MKHSQRDEIAALALGAAPEEMTAQLTGTLASDDMLRAQFRGDLEAVSVIGLSAHASMDEFPGDRKEHLKARILAAARNLEQDARGPAATFTRVVPVDKLVDFGPGIRWAVLPGKGITTVYWIFEPPDCSALPLETHLQRQSGYVLDGDFTFLYEGGRTEPLHAGNRYAIEPATLHGATFQSRTILCDVYEPPMEEFEKLYSEHTLRQAQGDTDRSG